jgi:hypothetical protein
MTHPMIERAARALCREHSRLLVGDDVLEDAINTEWKLFAPEAAIVIRSLLDPTDDMIEAGTVNLIASGWDIEAGDFRGAFRRALLTILEGEGK